MNGTIPFALLGKTNEMIASLGSGFEVKGVVTNVSDLPASGELGDLYMVSSEEYASYVWDGSAWELKDGGIASDEDIITALYS